MAFVNLWVDDPELLPPEEQAEFHRRLPGDLIAYLGFRCRDLYLKAARLLEVDNDNVQRVTKRETLDTDLLFDAYEIVHQRYLSEVHTDQLMLFPADKISPTSAWQKWFEGEFIPFLLHDNHAVILILQSLSIIPSNDYWETLESLEEFLHHMPMRQSYKLPHWCQSHYLPRIEDSEPAR